MHTGQLRDQADQATNANSSAPTPPTLLDCERLPAMLARYRAPNAVRSWLEIGVTLVPLVGLWTAMWALTHVSYWLTLVLALPTAGFLVRLFMIQHDCGHGAFFHNRLLNDWVGRVSGVLTLTPFDYWKRTHSAHHATTGNLGRRGLGDITTLTVKEYLALNISRRLGYRIYRHPLTMFAIGPSYLFLLQYRVPAGLMRGAGWRPWVSTMSTNATIAAAVALMMWLVGPAAFLKIHGPVFMLSATIGVWLFYVQHQFEGTTWTNDKDWSFAKAALNGSSLYDLPIVLCWFSANIGVHHVHHLASRIPFYRLPEVLRDFPELAAVGRLTLRQSLACVNYALWDEDARRLISFRTLRKQLRTSEIRGR
jgi:acyl-lipid omega-6 desaturase (Delta-12 desaturase)